MRLVTWNILGGIISLKDSNSYNYLRSMDADVICLQEIRTHKEEIQKSIASAIGMPFYHTCNSEKGGWAGVAIYATEQPHSVVNIEEQRGRGIIVEYDDMFIFCVYSPYSGIKSANKDRRLQWDKILRSYIRSYQELKPVVIAGDLNVAPTENDRLHVSSNWPGCYDWEAESFGKILQCGLTDSYRSLYPSEGYTWGRKGSKLRLDYVLHSSSLSTTQAQIGSNMHSDHYPLIVDL